jgi:hypothetical protein
METPKPTLDAAIAEVTREIALRERVYPKWVAARRLPQKQAEWQLRCMRRVLEELLEAKTWLPHKP